MCNLKFGSWNLLAFRRHAWHATASRSVPVSLVGHTSAKRSALFTRYSTVPREISKHEQFLVNWHCAWHFIFHAVSIIPIITIDLWHSCTGTFRFDPDSIYLGQMFPSAIYILWESFAGIVDSTVFIDRLLILIVSGTTRLLSCRPLLTDARQLRGFHYPD